MVALVHKGAGSWIDDKQIKVNKGMIELSAMNGAVLRCFLSEELVNKKRSKTDRLNSAKFRFSRAEEIEGVHGK